MFEIAYLNWGFEYFCGLCHIYFTVPMKQLFNILFSIISFTIFSTTNAQNNCDCKTTLHHLIVQIETEYPGFQEKTSRDKETYNNKKKNLLIKSEMTEANQCINVLRAYIFFFKDEHIFLQSLTTENNDTTQSQSNSVPEKEVEAKMIGKDIFYIKISSFQYDNIPLVKELVANHKKNLEKCKGLIIDIRDNGGGTDDVYQPLLPYILTNPIRIMSVEFFATNTLINGLRDYAVRNITQDSVNAVKEIDEGLKIYKDNLGEFVLYDDKKVLIDSIDISKKGPAQVIILANDNVASAGENFLFTSRQSKKVKIIGIPTMGALDYGSLREFKFGCDNYQLFLPTYRSARLPEYPIDNIGIQPDIFMDDSITDWIQFAINYIHE